MFFGIPDFDASVERWTLDAGLWTLGAGLGTLLLTDSGQNQNSVSDSDYIMQNFVSGNL